MEQENDALISLRLPANLAKRANVWARRLQVPRSQFIRDAIREYLFYLNEERVDGK